MRENSLLPDKLDNMDYVVAERLLEDWGRGDRESLDRLMGLVYHDLHRMAAGALRGESTTNRTRPTSLVNELYLGFVDDLLTACCVTVRFIGFFDCFPQHSRQPGKINFFITAILICS